MQRERERDRRVRSNEERARALTIGVVVVLLCFTTGLLMSLQGLGVDLGIANAPVQGSSVPRTVDGIVTYVRVDGGGHEVACSSTYSSSNCSTVGVVMSRHKGSK
jgi:hypothetical protein